MRVTRATTTLQLVLPRSGFVQPLLPRSHGRGAAARQRLVRLVLDGERALNAGTAIHTPDGEEVGAVTSATQGDGKTWLLGMVRYKQSPSGTELSVDGSRAEVKGCS